MWLSSAPLTGVSRLLPVSVFGGGVVWGGPHVNAFRVGLGLPACVPLLAENGALLRLTQEKQGAFIVCVLEGIPSANLKNIPFYF